jgi:hypothetical protein
MLLHLLQHRHQGIGLAAIALQGRGQLRGWRGQEGIPLYRESGAGQPASELPRRTLSLLRELWLTPQRHQRLDLVP